MENQALTLALLGVLGPLGAVDSLYFHLWKFRLATRPASRAETLTHVARSFVLAFVAPLLAFYEPHGLWFWVVGALLAVDFGNNLLDGVLEGESRRDLGGVPRAEYLLHLAGATWMGATTLSFFAIGFVHAGSPTGLMPATGMGSMLVNNAVFVGVGALALGLLELGLVGWTLTRRPSVSSERASGEA